MNVRTLIRLIVTLLLVGSMTDLGAYDYRDAPKKRKKPRRPRVSQTELDPLRFVKIFTDPDVKIGPNVVIALDTSIRMMYDFQGAYYDPIRWDKNMSWDQKAGDADPKVVAADLGVPAAARYYRRIYRGLARTMDNVYAANSIDAVDETEVDYPDFFMASRLGMARDGLAQAVEENMFKTRIGLVRMRTGMNTDWPTNSKGNQQVLTLAPGAQQDLVGDMNAKRWRLNYPLTNTSNLFQTSTNGWVMQQAQAADSGSETLLYLERNPDEAHSIQPFGRDLTNWEDSPVTNLLVDTRAEVLRLMDNDINKCRACRNTAVILVTSGADGGGTDPTTVAASFTAVTNKGVTKRVPIYVIAVSPKVADIAELKSIATASGGEYFEAYHADEIAWAANHVMQSVHRHAVDFDNNRLSEFQTVSPIVGTVNLKNAKDINGVSLPNTALGLTQDSNVVLTSGFTLPGFAASLRAFRTFKPVADATQKTGYKFVKDGTPLWVAHMPGTSKLTNGRRDPAVANTRNIYTYLPSEGGIVPFTAANAVKLAPYLQQAVDTADDLIEFVRDLPIGPIISSTPAIMNPPSLNPAPDGDYTTFANARASRRSLVFVGANDGMLHAIDARTGVEAWAFIPFNLLPKLQTLVDNQPVHNFEYMMDSSPKVADVKVGGAWRTYLIVGQGAGGTFYQTFDVSDAGNTISPESDSEAAVVAAFTGNDVIPFKWSFPRYAMFDHTISTDLTPFGDIAAGATGDEKAVGETWSDPAVGQVKDAAGAYSVIVGSGHLAKVIETQASRGGARAGSTLFVIKAEDGSVSGRVDVGDDTGRANFKNALQADPTAVGPPDTRFIDRIYIGDTEGFLWRFDVSNVGGLSGAKKIYDAKAEHPIFSSLAVLNVSGSNYVFFSTGIDTMPTTRKSAKFVLVGLQDNGAGTGGMGTKKFEIPLQFANNTNGDERATASPAVAGDIVFFTTTTEFPDKPCDGTLSSLYALHYLGGPAYDSTGDNLVNSSDQTMIRQTAGRASAAFVSDQHLYFGAGSTIEVFGDPEDFNNGVGQIAARLLSWREVR